jgi:peptidylprolyl isomerase
MQEVILFITCVVILVSVSFYRAYVSSGVSKLNGESRQEGIDFLALNRFKDNVEVTGSGLQYTILQAGTGTVHPNAKDFVKVHYEGTFVDGQVFDSTIKRGRPAKFGLNKVITGWAEGLQLMVVGEKRRFFVPAKLGYGNRWMGKIPPGSTLIFDVELLGIKD